MVGQDLLHSLAMVRQDLLHSLAMVGRDLLQLFTILYTHKLLSYLGAEDIPTDSLVCRCAWMRTALGEADMRAETSLVRDLQRGGKWGSTGHKMARGELLIGTHLTMGLLGATLANASTMTDGDTNERLKRPS
jgi:hypothetical protein